MPSWDRWKGTSYAENLHTTWGICNECVVCQVVIPRLYPAHVSCAGIETLAIPTRYPSSTMTRTTSIRQRSNRYSACDAGVDGCEMMWAPGDCFFYLLPQNKDKKMFAMHAYRVVSGGLSLLRMTLECSPCAVAVQTVIPFVKENQLKAKLNATVRAVWTSVNGCLREASQLLCCLSFGNDGTGSPQKSR